jgi:hypothetical protein
MWPILIFIIRISVGCRKKLWPTIVRLLGVLDMPLSFQSSKYYHINGFLGVTHTVPHRRDTTPSYEFSPLVGYLVRSYPTPWRLWFVLVNEIDTVGGCVRSRGLL